MSATNQDIRVLVVDDEPTILQLMEKLLTTMGLEVVANNSSLEALKKINEKFDMIITDKNMPSISGFDLINHAKQTNPGVVSILITAYSTEESVKEARDTGVDEYILKPFLAADFKDKIEHMVHLCRKRKKSN